MPAAVQRVGETEPTYIRLGAIFHDLPYYGNMIVEAIRYGLGSPALDEPWAYRMHSVRPDRFVASYIRAARTVDAPLTEDERLALVVGLLSHCALDLTLHPLVNYIARRDQSQYGGHESMHHRITEKYHALFFHIERLGFDPIGGPILQWTKVTKTRPMVRARVEPSLIAFMRDAYSGAYGDAPKGETWASWVRSFQHFGALVGNPLAALNAKKGRKDRSLYPRYFENETFRFWDFYAVSEKRAVELITLAHDYFYANDFSPEAEDAFCAASKIDDLAEPEPRDIPELPRLTVRCTPGVTAPADLPPWRPRERRRLERATMRGQRKRAFIAARNFLQQ